MPWVRFDDQYPIHRKVDGLTDAAFRLHTSAIFWCARNLTDGFVSKDDLDGVTARVRTPSRFAAECVRRGVWHDARKHECDSEKCLASVPVDNTYPQGWIIHDYWEYQPAKTQVVKERQVNRRRQQKWRNEHHGESQRNGSSNAVTNGTSKPAPSRPVYMADLVNLPNGSRELPPEIESIIISEIFAITSRTIDPAWAASIATHILDGRHPADPAAYIRQAIRTEPNPVQRFLPVY